MKLAGRVAAAIEILTEITTRHRPAAEALKDWGKAHRFAGSTDRHVLGTLVYDTLRRKMSAAALLGKDDPRSLVLGTLANVWAMPVADIASMCEEQFGPGALSAKEKTALEKPLAPNLSPYILGDFPKWLEADLINAYDEKVTAQLAALAQRAPIDMRVNTLKATREDVLATFAKFNAVATALSPWGLRIPAPTIESRNVNVEAETAHGLGQFEVQDEASQIATALTGAKPGETVLDLCAGAGGKSLALAAMLKNQGRVVAYDQDKHRLRPIFERITRAGATCIEVVAADEKEKRKLPGGYDLVVVDAPCTGSGTWRRKPDAKWRVAEKQLNIRLKEQADILENAKHFVKRGGRLAYFTCSILPQENQDQVTEFLKANSDFKIIPYTEQWKKNISATPVKSANGSAETLQLTPLDHDTDGFFASVMMRA